MTDSFDKFSGMDLSKINFQMPKIEVPRHSLPDVEKMMEPVYKAKREELERQQKTVELLEKLYDIAQARPEAVQQIHTLIQNSGTIHNMQNVYSGSSANQIITSNTGMSPDDFLKLIETMKEITSVLNEQVSKETNEIIEQVAQEVVKEDRKPGIVKASLSYLKNLFTEIIMDPSKKVAKEQFSQYAKEKAPEVIEGIEHILKNLSS